MKKTVFSLIALPLLALSSQVGAVPVELVSYIQNGTSTLRWDGCTDFAAHTPCINPANPAFAAAGIVPSTAVWDWSDGVLSMVGSFNSASSIGSNSMGPMVIGDKVTDLTVDTVNQTVTASAYACGEGSFLGGVGANGCMDVDLGGNFSLDSSVEYNVGGDASCVVLTVGGDDTPLSGGILPRGLTARGAGGGCDATTGAMDFFEVIEDNIATGGNLVIQIDESAVLTFARAPGAVDDSYDTVLAGVPTELDVTENDFGLTAPLTVAVTVDPTKGTAVPTDGDSKILYTADASESGADSFTYEVTDADGKTSTAVVSITILETGANDDPGNTTTRNQSVIINVGANDVGFEAGDVTVTIVGAPSEGGEAVPSAPGPVANATVTFTPSSAPGTPTYTETFTYEITDGVLTDTAVVTVTVNNTVPVANAGAINISTAGFNPSTRTGTFNASGGGNSLGNTPSVVSIADGPANGGVVVSVNTLTYTPDATFFVGTDTFDYTITDNDGETATGTVTVTIADVAPTPADASISVQSGKSSAALPLLTAGTAGNGAIDQHTASVSTPAASGTCAVTGTSVRYTANAGFVGADSCVVTVRDGDGDEAEATISITVTEASGGGLGGGGNVLPGGGGAFDAWLLSLLGAGVWLRRRRSQR